MIHTFVNLPYQICSNYKAYLPIPASIPQPAAPHIGEANGSRHQMLVRWVWEYFSGAHRPTAHMAVRRSGDGTPAAASSGPAAVQRTGLPPLYFQHDGHSRTIVGIERRPTKAAAAASGEGKGAAASAEDVARAAHFFSRKRSQPEAEERQRSSAEPKAFDDGNFTYTLLILDPSTSSADLSEALG